MSEKINCRLFDKYSDKAELHLEGGIAYKKADEFKDISSSQLRKILDVIKSCVSDLRNIENGRCNSGEIPTKVQVELFSLLPLTAYNAGRDKKLDVLYDFMKTHLTLVCINKPEDIIVFDELFTSIVAYHKYITSENKTKDERK